MNRMIELAPRLVAITAATEPIAAKTGCEMAESETPCTGAPTHFLWSDSYVKPMACCKAHAADAIFYQGAVDFGELI